MNRPSKEALMTACDWLTHGYEGEDDDPIVRMLEEVADYLAEHIARTEWSEHLDNNREEIERTQLPKDAEGRPLVTWAVFKRKAVAAYMRRRREDAKGGAA